MVSTKRAKSNPFIYTKPIQNPVDFFGQEQTYEKLVKATQSLQNILLRGEYHFGKTSLLLYLSNHDNAKSIGLSENQILVYMDYQDFVDATEVKIWQELIEALDKQLFRHQKSYLSGIREHLSVAKEFPKPTHLRRLLSALSEQHLSVHFLFDNFDKVVTNANVGRTFFGHLRSMISGTANVSYILAVTEDPSITISDGNGSPFFNLFTIEHLRPFADDDAFRLINTTFFRSSLDVSDQEKISFAQKLWNISDTLLDLTGNVPYFLQALCFCLYKQLQETENAEQWPLGQALRDALKHYLLIVKSAFERYWTSSSSDEQHLMTQIANRQEIIYEGNTAILRDNLLNRSLIINPDPVNKDDLRLFSSFFENWIKGELSPSFANKYADQIRGKSDKNKKIMHVFTGSKGGVGKTLLALTSAIKYYGAKKVLCLDLNFENPDFQRILQVMISKGNKLEASGNSKFAYLRSADKNLLLLRPLYPHTLPNSAIGFWDLIRFALIESYETHKLDPDVVIIDTNLHFASLLRVTTGDARIRTLKRIETILLENQINRFYIWYIWTLASLHENSNDPAEIQTTNTYFDRYLNKDDKRLYHSTSNFIHVLNPFALHDPLISIMSQDRSISQLENIEIKMEISAGLQIKSFVALAKAPTSKSISLKEFFDSTSKKLRDVIKKHPNNVLAILDILGDELMKISSHGRPKNLIIMPVYDPGVVGFTDYLITSENLTMDSIKERLGLIRTYFDKYLDVLERDE